jgi:tRNA nucleotidyltransferase/poly(A) polymerase
MSDYMFMLESHLGTDQNRVVAEVQAAAAEANVSLFLTGGAMRDMLGGFPIQDLDFTVEGNGLKVARAVAKQAGATIVAEDELRKSAELVFPGGTTAGIAMARSERYPKSGVKSQVTPASIHEDLGRRDFTVNAIALSLNRASRGLLIDPTNGLGDLERKELRTAYNYALYDDPGRVLRLVRLQVRLGFSIQDRTRTQLENVLAEQLETRIASSRLFAELRKIAADPAAADIVRALDEQHLLRLFSPALAGPKVNLAGLAKLQKAKHLIPSGVHFPVEDLGIFLCCLAEKLTPKEKAALIQATAMPKPYADEWQRLELRARKLESELKSPKLSRPSRVYQVLSKAPGEQILFLLIRSPLRLVQDRARNYLQKYLPMAQEIGDEEVRAQGVTPGTPKFQKVKESLIAAKLNARPKKIVPEPPPAETPPAGAPPPVELPPGQKGALRQPIVRT